MPSSAGRILTSHAGSLPRPEDLIEANRQRAAGGFAHEDRYQAELGAAVADVVARQRAAGIDLVNDGEYGHSMGHRYDFGPWWTYVFQRLGGLGLVKTGLMGIRHAPAESGEVVLGSFDDRRDWLEFSEAYGDPSAPGSASRFGNEFYDSDEELLYACADAMREEYQAIAIRDLPTERIRFHLCWGSWHGPHTTDIPLADIIDVLLAINASAYSFEAANVRHEHEWKVWQDVKLPEGKVILPGVVSHSTNVVEHPELVADRIVRFARAVGRENVVASTDCGLGGRVHPQIAWAKLETLAAGAEIATSRLWPR